jgi:hypothetical protein
MCSLLGSIPLACLFFVPPSHVIPAYGVTEDLNGGPGARADEEASSSSVLPKSPICDPTCGNLVAGLDCHVPTSSNQSRNVPPQHSNTSKLPKHALSPIFHCHHPSHLPPLPPLQHHRHLHILLRIRFALTGHVLFMVMERDSLQRTKAKIHERPLLGLFPYLTKHAKMWQFMG